MIYKKPIFDIQQSIACPRPTDGNNIYINDDLYRSIASNYELPLEA